jgi:hypothetical protein
MRALRLLALLLVAAAPSVASAQGRPVTGGGGVSAVDPTAFPDGSESAPSVTNIDDPNTGAWFCAADAVCISTGGAERFRLTTTALTLTVPISGADGSAAAPTYGWTSVPGMGFFRSGSQIAVAMASAGVWFWSSGHFLPWNNNAVDLGSSGLKVRAGYFGTDVTTPSLRDGGGNQKFAFSTVSGNTMLNQIAATGGAWHVGNSNTITTGYLMRWTNGANPVANQVAEVNATDFKTYDGVYLQSGNYGNAAPAAGDCDNDSEIGRMYLDTTVSPRRQYICTGATNGWDHIALTD